MQDLTNALQEGHYAKKQLYNRKAGLISWGHRARFQVALRLAKQYAAGKRLLDYGCGDGTFLAMLVSEPGGPAEAVGSELYQNLVDDCAKRFGPETGLRFVSVANLGTAGRFDTVFCMEVLEHVVELDEVIDRLAGVLNDSGKLIVSVPVETGLPLLVKQAARRVAAWRGIGHYPGSDPYTLRDYAASIFAGSQQHIQRPIHAGENNTVFHDHKGFNWMALRDRLGRRFQLESVLSSPIGWLPPHLGSQAWFVLSKKRP